MYKDERFYYVDPNVRIIQPDFSKKTFGRYLYIFKLLSFLRRHFKREDPDIIFAIGHNVLSIFASLWLNLKIIIPFRSSPKRVRFPNNKGLNSLYRFSHWIMKGRVDGMIAQTAKAFEIYNKRYKCPIVVIPNFLRDLKKYQIEQQNHIINVGHCSFEKGQHYLIEAFAKLNAPDWKLVIVGDGPKRTELQELSKLRGVNDRVIFTGYQKDVDFFLSQSKIFAFTSTIEGYPNALLEAMATPLPPVSFNCEAGPSDIIVDGENGFLVNVGDIETFAKRLQELIDQPQLRERIQQKASKVKDENDIMKIAPRYLKFFSDIAGE